MTLRARSKRTVGPHQDGPLGKCLDGRTDEGRRRSITQEQSMEIFRQHLTYLLSKKGYLFRIDTGTRIVDDSMDVLPQL